jgi:uncharacterized protein YbjT (DUF2867 family)
MKILVVGANGFIGKSISTRLEQAGHQVLRGVRRPRHAGDLAVDYTVDRSAGAWRGRLVGVDAVVNAVGILVEQGQQRFDVIHRDGPSALFQACSEIGVSRVVQISALGAERADTRYFSSKLAADTLLQSLPVSWQILRPSMVYGQGGAAAKMFRTLAKLPLHLLPAGGHQLMRPVHVEDLCEIVLRLLDRSVPDHQIVEVVGATEVEYGRMLAIFRNSMQHGPALQIPVPKFLIDLTAAVGNLVPGSPLTEDTWRMLQAGNSGDPGRTTELLGRPPLGVESFIRPGE